MDTKSGLGLVKQYIQDVLGGSLNPEWASKAPKSVVEDFRYGFPDPIDHEKDAIGPPTIAGGLLSLDPTDYVGPQTLAKAGAALKGLLTGKAAIPALAAITTWHGTPHKFPPTAKNPLGEFDLSKIGTGEGAQAYGHGVYVAEAPEVAISYRDGLSQRNLPDKAKSQVEDWARWAAGKVDDSTQVKSVVADLISTSKSNTPIPKGFKSWDDFAKAVENATSGMFGGSLYKVDLPDEYLSRFLDYDKPLSEQPEILKLLNSKSMLDTINGMRPSSFSKRTEVPSHLTGQQFLASELGQGSGLITGRGESGTQAMKNSGLLGIRYLDQGSRGAGQGSSNFVVFDPSILNILERNGEKATKSIPEAPRAEAFRIAQRNAAKPVSEGGLGLAADNTAMDRARAMGFDTDVYHGTGRTFDSFGNKPQMGNVSNGRDANIATFTSTNPAVSNEYAIAAAKAENDTVLARSGEAWKGPHKDELLSIAKEGGMSSAYDWNRYIERLVDYGPKSNVDMRVMDILGLGQGSANIMPLKIQSGRTSLTDFGGRSWSESAAFDALKKAQSEGKSGAQFSNIKDGLKGDDLGNTFAMLDPSAIRSRFAAFDPARRHEADLLGQVNPELLPWLIGAGLLGGAGVNSIESR